MQKQRGRNCEAETAKQLLNLINTILTIHDFCVNLHLITSVVDRVGLYVLMYVLHPLVGKCALYGGHLLCIWLH